MNRRNFMACACLFALTAVFFPAWGSGAQITGSATYRERIALPPDAVFEVLLEDVSRMDVPAVEIGRTTLAAPGFPPFDFVIDYDPAAIEPGNSYAVRATVRVDGALRFTSDTVHPVLTRGAGDEVDILMVAIARNAAATDDADDGASLRGLVSYGAEAAMFTDCVNGRSYEISPDGDFAALEHAYLAAGREPGLPMVATFEGKVLDADEGPSTVLVERFIGVWPDETCAPAPVEVGLTDTYWKLLRLGDVEILPGEGRREAHLMMRGDGETFEATVGCNQLHGEFSRDEDRLSFSEAISTMMACPPPLDAWESTFRSVLDATAHWRIDGTTLELFDTSGTTLARFEAVVAK